MAVKFSVAMRDALLNAYETYGASGGAPVLKLFAGTVPADAAASDAGATLVCSPTLLTDFMANSSSGSKTYNNLPLTANSTASGTQTLTFYRLYLTGGTTCFEQGTITSTAVGTGDMLVDNTSVANGQPVSITSWSKNMGNHA